MTDTENELNDERSASDGADSIPMWSSERALLVHAEAMVRAIAQLFDVCDDPTMFSIGNDLHKISSRILRHHAATISVQVPPNEVRSYAEGKVG